MFDANELKSLQAVTSAARLSSYSSYLGTSGLAEGYGAYMWSMAISTAFTPMIQTLEVGLRNAMHNELSKNYTNTWFEHWITQDANDLRAKSKPAHWKSKGEKNLGDAKDKITSREHPGGAPAGYVPPPQKVLAEMTFGFWTSFLFKRFYDVNHKTKLWPNHIAGVFPGAPPSMYAVGALSKAFDEAVAVRNRIHHHEPLWKHSSVVCRDDALKHLSALLNRLLTLMDYLDPSLRSAVERFGIVAAIEELCTQEAFERFVGRTQGKCISVREAKKDLRLLGKNIHNKQSVWVSSSSNIQLVVRHGSRRFF